MNFGEYLKNLRLARDLTLRGFCIGAGFEPGNYSKIERGLLQAPRSDEKLEPFRLTLRVDADSPEWRELLRLAALSRGEIPHRILSDKELASKLPMLFRSLEGDASRNDAALDELVAATRREFSA